MPTQRIPVDQLLILGNVPAGMNPLVVMALAYRLRSSGWDPKPIKVWHLGPELYRVANGRHRYFAAVIAGRSDVLAKVAKRGR